jgi:hypothetical protein
MKKSFSIFIISLIFNFILNGQTNTTFTPASINNLRAPAYPLITIDPYTSVWSFSDKLYDENPKHWTGTNRTFIGAARVDGKVYRFMGVEEIPYEPLVYTGDIDNWKARFTEIQPADNWEKQSFDDSQWKEGNAPFASRASASSTRWRSKDIWVRREFELSSELLSSSLFLKYSCDDFADIYINGKPVIKTDNSGKSNILLSLSEEIKKSIKPGKNIIAAHAHNEAGAAMLDFGIVRQSGTKISFEQSAEQKSVNLQPTQTYYTFECGPVQLDLIFTSPLLTNNLYLLSRPVNYVTYQFKSLDTKKHDVQVYFETTPEWAVNTISQSVTSERFIENNLTFLKTGTIEQPVLAKKGDDLRIDWGNFYLATRNDKTISVSVGESSGLKNEFVKNGRLSNTIDKSLPEKMYKKMTSLSYVKDLGKVGTGYVSDYLMIGYDDIFSIQYFGDNLPAYWTKAGTVDIKQAFKMAANDYSAIMNQCASFDKEMFADALKAGGKRYAELCALTYRQSIAAHKLVTGKDGELLFLSKENFSNGCIGTVDVTYPSAPLYLLYNPDLLKGMLNGIFYFSESGKWTKPFAAHDIGTYPQANGQVYREDMPVEEAGNMLILSTAISVIEGNATYAEKHWVTLSTWANYLLENGLDPANQLCTDDFAGHLAHNANLSVKAIVGIAGYGKMAEMLGKSDIASKYTGMARTMAREWIKMAKEDDHYKLTFDQPDTWSQKYNLIWNKILKLNIFPDDIAETEIRYYLTKQLQYGLPLDSRKTYTKSDWIIWTASLADDNATFGKLIDPIWKYANETSTRMPLSDWHETTDGKSVGFRARSVVGGYFMRMLEQKIK